MGLNEGDADQLFDMENFNDVQAQIKSKKNRQLLESTFTMVQRNKKGHNEVTDDNIKSWARRVYKK